MWRKIIFSILVFFCTNSYSSEDFFLMLKNSKVNVRIGPGFDYPIKFIYKKKYLPVKIIDNKENFRKIIDHKKNSGWIHISQLKKINSIITLKDKILFKKPSNFSEPLAKIKKGRVLVVQKCEENWCKINTSKFEGWIKNRDIWGQIN